ncbi:MAG: peptidase [Candidatus Aminicenantes bacterium]|nr:peptidase [Candidatus Aminicenantes bacterium]
MRNNKILISLLLLIALLVIPVLAQRKVTTPKEHFGFTPGDDYYLANYTQFMAYLKKIALESNRVSLAGIGITAEKHPMFMAIITSPENQKKINRYKEISRHLALAEGLTDSEARELASEGRAVVWIDGGLHGTEVLGAQHLIELIYQMASRNDPETLRILNDVILLAVPSNPDGMELVADWYMREKEPAKRSMRGLPRLYQKYIGHDNNRDFYMVTQPETEAVNRVLYCEWFPQIVYNQHQSGPAGTVLFAPPFRDPFNYCYDPLVPLGIELVGAAMHSRFVAEGKPGATMREGARYSTWWNGGLRTTAYYHNMIGILTETIGSPTPIEIPFLPEKQLPKNDLPAPIAPQKWHFRQSIEYVITADRAILDLASKHREDFLFNIYLMGKNSIERGSRDHWTIHPQRIAAVEEAIKKDKAQRVGSGRNRGYPHKYYEMLFDPAERDPRAYILPSNQPDFLTATKFVNALIKNGITVLRATDSFKVGDKSYPSGSYVVKAAQAFRPHILSMFEPQDHPDDIPYPGAAPIPPYDNAGWTLVYQMGVEFDRIFDSVEGPLEKIEDLALAPAGKVTNGQNAVGFLLDHRVNDAFIAINRLLLRKEDVYWLKEAFQVEEKTFPAGTIYIPAKSSTLRRLGNMAKEIGLNFEGIDSMPSGEALRLQPLRIGLWDQYGGSMPSGWVRWLLEQFEFPFKVVYPATLDAGDLNKKYDVLIFVRGAIPLSDRPDETRRWRSSPQPKPENVPPEYRKQLGKVTVAKTVPKLLEFMKNGGTLLAISNSTSIGFHAGLPISDALIEKLKDGKEKPLPREKYFVPGSILQVSVDNTNPLAYGLPKKVDVSFNNSPVFRIKPEAAQGGMRKVAWFENKNPLRSGWALGKHYLQGGIAIIEADVGQGKLFLYGPEITRRAQPHGTFKFLFNGIYYGGSTNVKLE